MQKERRKIMKNIAPSHVKTCIIKSIDEFNRDLYLNDLPQVNSNGFFSVTDNNIPLNDIMAVITKKLEAYYDVKKITNIEIFSNQAFMVVKP